ncbi:MAG TPA: bacteriohopanetetrol glucosamine biosynthesis glycosyltransferase HpnI [Candidatus Saccharimonadales bacterium]|jgi:ceramide glucosyltransferase|nr:bacteriohopanetetrol glucosamine biosynthesis glycosyltransferase HpnI [Candidatus Saccharimonadales bacterium]
MTAIIATVFAVLLAGSLVYCALIMVASWRYLSVKLPSASGLTPPISVLKPLCGYDEGLEENLRSFLDQDYPAFEVLFAVHRQDDPAVAVVEKIKAEYSGQAELRLIVTGESPVPNAKAFSLKHLVPAARHPLLVMSDSDVRVTPSFLAQLAREFHDPSIGLITCPYRAVGGSSVWSQLEALGMNTEFLGGVLVARMMEGMNFALGCTVAIRSNVLDLIGGFDYLQDYLAEDFVMGQRVTQLGQTVLFSSYVIEHRIGSQKMAQNLDHRLRWARSTRRSRPAGYWGQIFTYPLAWALLLWAAYGGAWPLVLLTLIVRAATAWATAGRILRDPVTPKQWLLLPLQDLLGFMVWIGGFLGSTIVWRERRCIILSDGRLQVKS